MTVLAHGVGQRIDLPIPLGLALYGGGFAILISFAVLLLFWRTPRLGDATSGRPVPAGLQRFADSSRVRAALQALALLCAAFVLAVALFGPRDIPKNLAPWALYVTFWVGLVPASLLLGPVWRVLNPLRLLARALPGRGRAAERLPALGLWPGAVSLFAFVWLELVPRDRAQPTVVAGFLIGYAVVHLAAAWWFGDGWFAHGDGFEVYSTLLGRLSVWGRRDDGRLVLRSPLSNAMAIPAERGLAAVVVVLLGSTAFDGLTRTSWWQSGPGAADDLLSGTLGLLAMTALVAALYNAGTRLSARMGRLRGIPFPRLFAATVVPIALGYTIAHYFSLFVLDGQTTWILASNPFGVAGIDLFGTYGNVVDLTAVGPDAIALVQVGAVVTGHVVGVTLAHERALRLAPKAPASDQLPLVLVMIVFTIGGLGLLFGF
ncbi:hypothetical protein [Petropleomorpha daqingensis]|uniref:Fenitrothion hydrolase n=1 Tax=Petropleomorpha daqingensis TaxID=2026353 RepID=A0A853CIJ0_9ACTN|nr:hypothetical protein [Petropleomorpha daqingensis]